MGKRTRADVPDTPVLPLRFNVILAAARRADWKFVDTLIGRYNNLQSVMWAIDHGLTDVQDDSVRDLAATILSESTVPIPQQCIEQIERAMLNDSYNVVRYRLAIALYERGYHKDRKVSETVQQAARHPDLYDRAVKAIKSQQ
jgi:hypothetical protein